MKGRMLLLVSLLLIALVAVAACGDEGDGAGVQPEATPTVTPTVTPTAAGEGADGGQVFAATCAGCHGQDGSGGFGPDIRGEDDLAGIESQVRGGGSRMPAFDGELSDEEISAVAQFVTGL